MRRALTAGLLAVTAVVATVAGRLVHDRFGPTGDMEVWFDTAEPEAIVATVLAIPVSLLGLYTGLLAVLVALAGAPSPGRRARLARRLAVGPLRPLVGAALTAVAVTAASSTPAPAPVVLVVAGTEPGPAPETPPPPASITRLPAAAAADAPAPAEWLVEPGDHFWSIAEQVVGSEDAAVVAPYWRRLVEANEDRLVVPGEADLILPGQRLRLPPAPA